MRVTILCCILSVVCVLSSQSQAVRASQSSLTGSPCPNDLYCYDSVQNAFEMLKPGRVSVGSVVNPIVVLGDRASIALVKLEGVDELATAENTWAYLRLVEVAFANPDKILQHEDRNPNVTLLLLNYLEIKTQDSAMKKQIEDTKRFVEVSVGDPPGSSH